MRKSLQRSLIFSSVLAFSACTKKAEEAPPAPQAEAAPPAALSAEPAAGTLEVTLMTEMHDGAVHWKPGTVDAKPGQLVRFTLRHELKEGFDFHGFSIPALGLSKQVNRNQPLVVDVQLPADMAPGEYPIACQFHPKHVAAKLVVR